MRPFVWAECAQHIHVNVLPGCFQISRANPKRLQLPEERVCPRNTLAPFVRVRCAAQMTILAHLERRAVHMEPCTWPSQTCFVSLLGFVSFSTYFSIRNQLQLVTLWKGPARCQLDTCGWQVGWIRRRCVETGPALRFCGGLGVDKPRSLVSCGCSPFCLGRVCSACSCQRASRLLPNK